MDISVKIICLNELYYFLRKLFNQVNQLVCRKPEILILDDSASALDFATEKKLNENIKKLDGKVTTFIVTQRASSILTADKIIVLEDGQIAGIGTHDELMKKNGFYAELYNSQFDTLK